MEDKLQIALLLLLREEVRKTTDVGTIFDALKVAMEMNALNESVVYATERACDLYVKGKVDAATHMLSIMKPELDEIFGRMLEQVALRGRLQKAITALVDAGPR